jgi:sugar phosphate permease
MIQKNPRIFYGWVVLARVLVILVLGYSVRNTFSVFYPTIGKEFSWPRANTALMFSIPVNVYGLIAPVAGGLIDGFGPRLVVPVGAVVMGVGFALCGLANTQWQFYLFYGVITALCLSLVGWAPLSLSSAVTDRRMSNYG